MVKGDSSILLLSELVDMLGEIGKLHSSAQEVQGVYRFEETGYALVWYVFNVRQAANTMAALASTLESAENKTRSLSDFIRLSEGHNPLPECVVLHDLKTLHKTFNDRMTSVFKAYSDVLEGSTTYRILRKELEIAWRQASENLHQADEIRNLKA